ncbi:hypothetical protein HDK90DRAFT_312705 [Phyllosticta capitalensis]|uniref:Mg2+ transporter protein, CorA-like/Zinc transport protein ZntB n=1 Tax=Phyllosticta capitalensis TaxID=121624 RepID=A0ABR1YLY3_9PEZI
MPMANQPRSDHYYISWMKIHPILAKKNERYLRTPDEAMLVRRTRGHPSEVRLLATSERLWCFQMPRTVVITCQSESEKFENTLSAFETLSHPATTIKLLAAGLACFKLQRQSSGPELSRFLQTRICQIALDDEYEILTHIEEDLGRIDVEISFENMGFGFGRERRTKINRLKMCMGRWRRHILSRHNLQRCMERITKAVAKREEAGAISAPSGEEDVQCLEGALSGFGSKLDGTLRHFESTFSALIGTMSINESTRALQEAEEITKLTQLAFFFIPLTFVAGIFGMNVKELTDVNIWIWAVTSICLLATTYCVLYPKRCLLLIFFAVMVMTIPVWLIPKFLMCLYMDTVDDLFDFVRSWPLVFRIRWDILESPDHPGMAWTLNEVVD